MNRLERKFASLDDKLDTIIRLLSVFLKREGAYEMATAETLARLQADVAANTSAAASAAAALNGFVSTVADLTAALQAAIEGGDEEAIKAAADAIEANNKLLADAIPAMSTAVVVNTPSPM